MRLRPVTFKQANDFIESHHRHHGKMPAGYHNFVVGSEVISEPGEAGVSVCIERGAQATMRPFFGFYGGKWRDAPKHYLAPKHDTIVEPFAGSAGYSVRYADRKVILGEKDAVIFGVWEYLVRVSARDILAIPDLEPGQTVADLPLCEEARWLVGFWLNRGASRPRTGPSAWMRDGIRPGSFWGERVRQTIAAQVDRIRHWRVFNCSYENLPFAGEATWFVDPPYQKQGKHYHHGAEDIEFEELGNWCRTRPGQVIVCENEGADWLPFTPLADVKTTRANSRSVEVVWVSEGSPYAYTARLTDLVGGEQS